jgi:hypothetical protein
MTTKQKLLSETARIRALGHRFTAATIEYTYFRCPQAIIETIAADLMEQMASITESPKEGEEWA